MTSNIGQLLGTGILDEQGVRDVVARLTGPDMLSGYGVRTMSGECGGYWPQSYHCGSVWAHDSAIVMLGLAAEGYIDEAVRIAEGLVRAADAFGYQIPELYAGDAGEGGPAPYPAACHPQAWAAASSVAVASLLLGLTPDGEGRPIEARWPRGGAPTRDCRPRGDYGGAPRPHAPGGSPIRFPGLVRTAYTAGPPRPVFPIMSGNGGYAATGCRRRIP